MQSIIGHSKIIEELQHDLADGHLAHGYLFVGPVHLGKTTVAQRFAEGIQNGSSIDTIEIPDDGVSIKIEQIRDIIVRLNMTAQGAYKVLIVSNIARMTPEAANCMLKTLEEPPDDRTIFLFTVNSLRNTLPTITSRMRVVQFRKIPDEELRAELQKKYPDLDEELMEYAVTLALGRPGRAVSLIEDADLLNELRQLYAEAETLLQRRSPALHFTTIDALLKAEPERLKRFMETLLLLSRRYMLETKDATERKNYADFIAGIVAAQDMLGKNVNAKLLLENLLLRMV